MKNYLLLLLFTALFTATFSGCKKDEDDDDNNNTDLTTCPGKYEGIYKGTVTYFNGTVYNNVETALYVVGSGSTAKIVLTYFNSPADTIYATMNCDLKTFTIPAQTVGSCNFEGYGTISADGTTLTYNISNNGSGCGPTNLDGTFTKLNSSAFRLFVAEEVTAPLGQPVNIPVTVRKIGTFNNAVILKATPDAGNFTATLGVTSGTPTLFTNLTVTPTLGTDIAAILVEAISGTDTSSVYVYVNFIDANCDANILGSYTGTDCFGDNFTVTVTTHSATQVKIACTYSSFVEDFIATYNCEDGSLTIPRQFIISDPNYEIEGTGFFYRIPGTTDYSFSLSTIYYSSGQTQPCSFTFQ